MESNKKSSFKKPLASLNKEEVPTPKISALRTGLLIFFCCIAATYFLNKEVNHLQDNIHWGDETLNIALLRNISESGIPTLGSYSGSITSPLNNPTTLHTIYWSYMPELYLRYPFYAISTLFSYDWKTFSSLFFVYLIFFFLIFYSFKKKVNHLPAVIIGFFLVLISYANYSSSQFHYVRYYPFTIILMSLMPFVCTYIYTYNRSNNYKKSVIILFLAFLPGLFHHVNFSFSAYWIFLLIVLGVAKAIAKEGIKKYLQTITTKTIIISTSVLIGIILFAVFLFQIESERLFIGFQNAVVVPKFISFFLGSSFNKFIYLLGIVTIVLAWRKFTSYEKNLFSFSIGYIIFSLAVLSVVGGKDMVQNYYAYMMFFFPTLMIIVSIMLYSLYLMIVNIAFPFPYKEEVLFTTIIVSTCLIYNKQFKANENTSRGTTKEYNEIKNYIEKYKDCVFITSDNSLYFYAYFPNNAAYLCRTYDEITDTMSLNKAGMYRDKKGYIRNVYGEFLVGKREMFAKMLKDNLERKICLYNVIAQTVDPELINLIKDYVPCNPFTAKYMKVVVSDSSSTWKLKEYKNLLNQADLFPEEYLQISGFLYNANLFNECIDACNQVLKIRPQSTIAYLNICASFLNLQNWDAALNACEKVLEIDPSSVQAKSNLAYIKSKIKK